MFARTSNVIVAGGSDVIIAEFSDGIKIRYLLSY